MDRAEVARLHEVGLRVEHLAGAAVEAGVGALVEVAGVVQVLDERLHPALVLRIRGADEEVVGRLHRRRQPPELRGHAVAELLRRQPGRLGRPRHVAAVLVRAGQEEDVIAALAVVPGQDVGGHGRVRVPEVRVRVHVVDRCGDRECHI